MHRLRDCGLVHAPDAVHDEGQAQVCVSGETAPNAAAGGSAASNSSLPVNGEASGKLRRADVDPANAPSSSSSSSFPSDDQLAAMWDGSGTSKPEVDLPLAHNLKLLAVRWFPRRTSFVPRRTILSFVDCVGTRERGESLSIFGCITLGKKTFCLHHQNVEVQG